MELGKDEGREEERVNCERKANGKETTAMFTVDFIVRTYRRDLS